VQPTAQLTTQENSIHSLPRIFMEQVKGTVAIIPWNDRESHREKKLSVRGSVDFYGVLL